MTLSTSDPQDDVRASSAANGSTTTFSIPFKIWAASNLKVYLHDTTSGVDTLQALTTDYTIDIVSYPNTGNIIFNTAPASGQNVVRVRDMPLSQELDLIASGTFPAENIETQLDKLSAQIQGLRELVGRSPRMPVGSTISDIDFPDPALNPDGYVKVNAAGTGLEAVAQVDLSGSTVSAFVSTLLDDANATAFLATLGLTISAFVKTLLDDGTAAAFLATLGVKSGSATIDFASANDNTSSTGQSVTVTGAAVGDVALATAAGNVATTDQVWLLAKVTAADTVKVNLHNDSGGAFDAASQTIYAFVIPKSLFGL